MKKLSVKKETLKKLSVKVAVRGGKFQSSEIPLADPNLWYSEGTCSGRCQC